MTLQKSDEELPSWTNREKRRARFKPTWRPRGETEWTDATLPLKRGFIQRTGPETIEAWVITNRPAIYIEKARKTGFNVPFPNASTDSGEVYIVAPLNQFRELVKLCGGTKGKKRTITESQRDVLRNRLKATRTRKITE